VEKRSVRRETAGAQLIAQSLPEEADNDLEAAEETQQQLALTLQRLEELPPRQAMAIKLRYLQELEYQEIAHRMNATPWAVRCLVSRGLSRLRAAS
jgi:RNA polymerase sigma factor (sigma-70 family)